MPNVVLSMAERKRALRAELRTVRRSLPDQKERSVRLWSLVRDLPELQHARTVMAFDSVPGEPITASFVAWCRAEGKVVVVPEDDPPPDPEAVDVVIVPGIAFTRDGRRLGQGGGWYDRFLAGLRPGTPTVGVCFEPLLVDDVPTEAHDVRVSVVVTDATVERT